MDLMHLTAVELGRKIKDKEVTVEEAVTAALDAIEKKEEKVHSFVTVDREGALPVFRLQSKTICARRICLRLVLLRFYIILFRPIPHRQSKIWSLQAQ